MCVKTLRLLLILIACLGVQAESAPRSDSDNEQIAFISDRSGNTEIYVMNSDGSMQTPLANLNSHIFDLAWSPDGKQLAFSADYGSKNADIYLLDVFCERITTGCTSTPVTLTRTVSDDVEPAWSPDGSKIAFRSGRDDLLWNIFIVEPQQTHLTLIADDFNDFSPTWSPDGTHIAVQSLRDDNWDIYVLSVDGSEPIRLTRDAAPDYRPRWSPDGSKIAFVSDRDGNLEIYTMNVDGSDVARLTKNKSKDIAPSWRVFLG